ncbi:hypothetical protein DL768_009705 [Monosporascus sp. mg162]|nr:hypothetical protein DL768_009705 [Monosporascus sp. mg162]
MANISPKQQVSPTEVVQHTHTPVEQGGNSSAHSDSAEEEEPLDIDQDDAQSFIQPALGPAAIRLTSPKTPAAEKAAAMEALPGGGLFRVIDYPPDPGTVIRQLAFDSATGGQAPTPVSTAYRIEGACSS